MSSSRWTDYLGSHRFWAMDISGSKQVPVFTPLFGFSGISSPKISAELESFKDGTYNYSRHIVKGGSVSPITFTRAASLYDSDFYDWIYYAINGTNEAKSQGLSSVFLGDAGGPVRRSIMVIHFSSINLAGGIRGGASSAALAAVAAGVEATIFTGLAGISLVAGAATSLIGGSAAGFQLGPFSAASWLPARMWILHDCIPTEYTAGSDFDANSAAISLMNLTVMPEWIEEFSAGI